MEFDIDIHTGLNGKITIEDYSQEYNQYFPETQTDQTYGRYKYSECKTLNVVLKITSTKTTLLEVLQHNHDQKVEDPTEPGVYIYDLEKVDLTLHADGYYNIHHVIIPTQQWFTETFLKQSDEYRKAYETIYILGDDNKIYKYINETFVECSVEEIIKRNLEGTTIEKCVIDVFYTGFLQLCYINYCRQLFAKLAKNCNVSCTPENVKDLTYIRDFLWMVLNIIDYQISFKQYMEAQRLLESVNGCGNFCKNQELNAGPNTGCGCS